jgi:hypothetical protein
MRSWQLTVSDVVLKQPLRVQRSPVKRWSSSQRVASSRSIDFLKDPRCEVVASPVEANPVLCKSGVNERIGDNALIENPPLQEHMESMNCPNRSSSLSPHGPEVGPIDRAVKYSFVHFCRRRGSRSVPMHSVRKSSKTCTLGVRRDWPENRAHNVIGSGFQRGNIGTS